jgi:hypothetical protein
MPKRTNAFQNLFHLIYRHRAEGAIVTESKMLVDKVTGKQREVDLVIQSTVAGHAVTIGVECNAKKRKASTQWIEEMQGKHKDLPTDKLILVSQAGFYGSARKKAAHYGFDTITLDKALKVDWTSIAGKIHTLMLEYVDNRATYTLHLKRGNGQIDVCAPPNECEVISNDGTTSTVNDLVNSLVASKRVREQVFKLFDAGGGPTFNIDYVPERGWYVRDPTGEKSELVRLLITLDTAKETTPVPLVHGTVGSHQVAYGEASYSKGKMFFATLEAEGQPAVTAIKWPKEELKVFEHT